MYHCLSFCGGGTSPPRLHLAGQEAHWEHSAAHSPTRSYASALFDSPASIDCGCIHRTAHIWSQWPPYSAAPARWSLREGHSRLPLPASPVCSGTGTTKRSSQIPFRNIPMDLPHSTSSLAAVSMASSAFASETTSPPRARTRADEHGAPTS